MRIDQTHKKWAIITAALFAVATVVYVLYATNAPGGPSGGSAVGLTFGIAGYALMIFTTLLSLRKKFPVWRIGKAQTWMRGHIWMGLLSYPLILYHAGFSLGGPLTTVLFWLITLVVVSGVLGAILQHVMPRLITQRVPMETIYDQIDRVQAQLLEEADNLMELVTQAASQSSILVATVAGEGGTSSSMVHVEEKPLAELRSIYDEKVRPYLTVRSDYQNPLYIRKNSKGMFNRLRTMTPPAVNEILDDLENICEEKRDLDRQSRMHRILHGWLLVHIPLSFALTVLGLVHAVMALRY